MGEPQRSIRILFGSLVFVLGAQSARFLFSSLAWYLRDTVGIGTIDLIPIALAPFLVALVLPILSRWLGISTMLWVGAVVLATARVVNQVIDDPAADLWSAGVGTAAFVGMLPLVLSLGRVALVGAVLLGIAVDTAIRGAGLSLDLAYQPGLTALVAVIATGLALLYLLSLVHPVERRGVDWGAGATMLGIGPYLLVQFLILQTPGWITAMTGMPAHEAGLRIALLNLAGLAVAVYFERSRVVLTLSAVAVAAAMIVAEGGAFNLVSIAGIIGAGPLFASLIPDSGRERIAASAAYLTSGSILFLLLGFAYYLPVDLRLGFTQAQVRVAVGLLVGLIGLAAMPRRPAAERGLTRAATVVAAGALLLPILAFVAGATDTLDEGAPGSYPLRVMSYNLHSAFDTEGRMDVEEIARVIEDSGATVIGLQEVTRGRLLNGGADLLALLQERLGFPHVAFFGTSEPVWGNAILSRHPIGEVETAQLPTEGTPLRRGYLGVEVSVASGEVLFISTHLQHLNDPAVHDDDPEADLLPVHRSQLGRLLEVWGGRRPAILVGDFNARPGWAQMEELMAAGWVDSWDEAGSGPGFTSGAADPQHRIDWILHTPDLAAADAGVIQSQASDHFPVVADIMPAPVG